MDKISIVLPTYNRENIIGESIESVLNQTYSDFELLIVNDASTDETEAKVASYADRRIRYVKLEKNGGVSRARNEGVKLASHELVAFEDSDDVWYPEKLEKQMRYWKKIRSVE